MPTTKTPRTTPAPAANKPAATAWQPAPGSHCHRAIVYMLTSGATHYRPAEIAAALGIRNGRVHEGLRPAIKAGAVFSVPDPAHGTFRLYTIAPGWQLQNQPAPDAAEADPWPRQRWINADGTVRMDRTGAASTGATTSATTGTTSTKADTPAPHPANQPAAEAAEPTAQTTASPAARTTCDTAGTCQGYQPPCPGCTRAKPMLTTTAATHYAATHRLALHVDTAAQAIHLTRGAEYITLTLREAATIGPALVAFGM